VNRHFENVFTGKLFAGATEDADVIIERIRLDVLSIVNCKLKSKYRNFVKNLNCLAVVKTHKIS